MECPYLIPSVFPVGSGAQAAFLLRVPDLDVATDREEALRRLADFHRRTADGLGFRGMCVATAEQVHGAEVATVIGGGTFPAHGADALVTSEKRVCLGIYVADCAAVYLVHQAGRGVGLAHSGRKGTELNITAKTVSALKVELECEARELVAWISPCIRPPHYEVDFVRRIVAQLREAGVGAVHFDGRCTACHPDLFYSYRAERGRTGRMLALLALGG
jgi:hypothetical protein